MKENLRENILKLKNDGLSQREISIQLNCSKSTVQYHCKDKTIFKRVICVECGNEFETKIKTKKCCSTDCRRKFKNKYLKSKGYCYDKLVDWRIKNKKLAIEYKGGSCIICGYSKCMSSLDFHHLDPSKKNYSISKNKNSSFEKMKPELDKCVLLCSNCHGEVHDGLVNIEKYLDITISIENIFLR
jgi:hypothetical protein